MKNFKSLALVFAAAIISLGVNAQAATTAKPAAKADTKKTAVKKADTKATAPKADAKKDAAKPATK
jgi:hypothetical protein